MSESPEPKALRERVRAAIGNRLIVRGSTQEAADDVLLVIADWLDEQNHDVEVEYVSAAVRMVAADLRREAS